MAEAPLWETSKENAAPLERGRSVQALERSLQTETAEERSAKEKALRLHEARVLPSERGDDVDDDDPLLHWLAYIKFHQEAFPSDTHAQFLLMERCTRALVNRERYANDVRFIRVCITYADKTSFPADVFKYLHQLKVGTLTSLFWSAWAWVAEARGDFDFAEKLFRKGISKGAKPLEILKQRHKQFQRRFAKHLLKEQEERAENDEDEEYSKRGTLGGLTEERVRRNDRAQRNENAMQRRQNPPPASVATFRDRSAPMPSRSNDNGATVKGGFAIFVDDAENNHGYNLDQSHVQEARKMEREVDRKKENTGETERWNDRGGLGSQLVYSESAVAARPTRAAAAGSSFTVYTDEECAAKLQREEHEKQTHMERARRDRDERTLRQRTEEGVAEKLTRDPMRYVRNPSKLATDQQVEEETSREALPKEEKVGQSKRPNSIHCAFDKTLVQKGADGLEKCFEEGRARFRYFQLTNASNNFNLLAVAGLNDSTMEIDVSMEDVSMVDERKRPPVDPSSSKKVLLSKVLFAGDTSIDSQSHPNNLSTASSTVNERDAVGVAGGVEEETINTKLAMKELSMMFSSPAMGLNDLEPHVEDDEDEGDTATFSIVAGLVDEDAVNNSVLRQDSEDYNDENDENCAPRNPDARASSAPDFDETALRTLEGDEQDGLLAQAVPRVTEGVAGFQIYCDEDDDSAATDGVPPAAAAAPFQIYQDESEGVKRESVGDTATFSIIAKSELLPPAAAPFEIFEDDDSVGEKRESTGDTATFSVFGDAMKVLEGAGDSSSNDILGKGGFSIYVDENDSKTEDFKGYQLHLNGSPEFGDISRIVPDDGDVPFHRRAVSSPKPRQSDVLAVEAPLDYEALHRDDIRQALRQVQVEARKKAFSGAVQPRDNNLTRVLSTKGFVDDLPKQSMPKAFVQKTPAKGSMIILGRRSGIIKQELGRGGYGKVVLMESKDDAEVDVVAVKAQAPTDCLALEYVILKAAEERVGPHCESFFPYPKALSFISLADGGLLGMTTGSKSGINLVDLANVYQAATNPSPGPPEMIAIHYTIRMLKHIEALHWHGKILHCDVKPDNWVLTASDFPFDGCEESIDGSDLMLVDFGRAVDLKAAAKSGIDPLDVRLQGKASDDEMLCLAMRKDLSWSFDTDTYGVCASAHVLLYGTHMEIEMNPSTKRWKHRKPLRRYWQKDLWNDFFDTLLNLDEVSQTALGSRPGSVREIRRKMEAYLYTPEGKSDLESGLKHQATLLPSARPS